MGSRQGAGRRRLVRVAAVATVAAAATLLVTPAASASGGDRIDMQDRCDVATFNAFSQENLGFDICFVDGNVTFEEFVEELNPDDGGHGAWRFSREQRTLDRGAPLAVRNTGGEVHSFTEVVAFGSIGNPLLDAALPPGTPPAVPVDPAGVDASFLPPGGALTVSGLAPGRHRFQCLIHPWMRSTVDVRR
ncbi:MAG: hypothetical protein NTW05_24390 [Pseudonocardiales bacterium]|nr:hypothetical protein [Pseudonocardiales bacterium]